MIVATTRNQQTQQRKRHIAERNDCRPAKQNRIEKPQRIDKPPSDSERFFDQFRSAFRAHIAHKRAHRNKSHACRTHNLPARKWTA
jgi:hypothetical protein